MKTRRKKGEPLAERRVVARGRQRRLLSKARLREMIEEAIVDASGESEQIGGFYAMIEDNLALPFETTVLGVAVTVKGVDLTERDQIVSVCTRGRDRQTIPILDLPLPSPLPAGTEWIEAYRCWLSGGW